MFEEQIKLGQKLKVLRTQAQLSLRDVSNKSEKLGDIFYESYVSKIEHGEVNVTYKTLLRLLNIYNTSIEDFYHNDKS